MPTTRRVLGIFNNPPIILRERLAMPHNRAMENISTAHAHISTAAADCDGPLYRDYTVFVSDEAKAKSAACDGVNDFWEIEFRNGILTSQVSLYAVGPGGCKVEIDADGDFTWHEGTEEGYRSGEVRFCEEASCDESYSQRDVYAEMMGY